VIQEHEDLRLRIVLQSEAGCLNEKPFDTSMNQLLVTHDCKFINGLKDRTRPSTPVKKDNINLKQ